MKPTHYILLAAILGSVAGCTTTSSQKSNEALYNINLNEAHLRLVLKQYGKIFGMQVDLVEGLSSPRITLQTNKVTIAQQQKLIEQKLADENIGLFQISTNRVVASWLVPETDPARKYLNACRASKTTVPLGKFGWGEAREYWNKVPELQASRDEFDQANDELVDVLMQDEEYRRAMEEYKASTGDGRKVKSRELSRTKSKVYHRLMKESEIYREARKKRDEALFNSNIQTLEYIINDYEAQGKEFPVDWIGKQ